MHVPFGIDYRVKIDDLWSGDWTNLFINKVLDQYKDRISIVLASHNHFYDVRPITPKD